MSAFKLSKSPRVVTWPVTVNVPQDGGTVTEQTFNARFKLLPIEESDRIIASSGPDKQDLLRATLTGWDGILDDDTGAPIDFSDEALGQVLNVSYVRVGLLDAYFQAAGGRAAQEKN